MTREGQNWLTQLIEKPSDRVTWRVFHDWADDADEVDWRKSAAKYLAGEISDHDALTSLLVSKNKRRCHLCAPPLAEFCCDNCQGRRFEITLGSCALHFVQVVRCQEEHQKVILLAVTWTSFHRLKTFVQIQEQDQKICFAATVPGSELLKYKSHRICELAISHEEFGLLSRKKCDLSVWFVGSRDELKLSYVLAM